MLADVARADDIRPRRLRELSDPQKHLPKLLLRYAGTGETMSQLEVAVSAIWSCDYRSMGGPLPHVVASRQRAGGDRQCYGMPNRPLQQRPPANAPTPREMSKVTAEQCAAPSTGLIFSAVHLHRDLILIRLHLRLPVLVCPPPPASLPRGTS